MTAVVQSALGEPADVIWTGLRRVPGAQTKHSKECAAIAFGTFRTST